VLYFLDIEAVYLLRSKNKRFGRKFAERVGIWNGATVKGEVPKDILL